ncbi:ABC transporter ATP-binding protein [Bacillus thuringiensis]|uniref:ABC transporter, ATP-binding protein n=2 Tax=Bacillus thuringiensis TaxID=1428 RepID=A0A9W3KJJ7_BACTU|nr:ATP-binding cassette domain-containing protein [Bacillus thuringiensis]EKS8363417.1 ATP-binding cassette domain-containing protein [Bacillus cereus]AHA73124.1 ABC transporter, ATP-binding protein [Bacillus thuringiensis YBT-1518]EKS8372767.1 ATP-binding cassette domain-containing protein [Bacillus cereus]MBG9484961.1 ABC transporter ATP-binding protein [Bacillus thuringiensis]MBG9493553.1 ABC transporter ATP-binding protein [Bacillus thuringiensis]
MNNEIVLEANHLTKTVGGKTIVNDFSTKIYKGDICGFLGPNGAGKTTVMRMFTGLIRPTKGAIKISGQDVNQNRQQALMNMGAIIESPIFFPYMTGRKMLQNLARLYPALSRKEQLEQVEAILSIVRLTEDANVKIKNYSLGMRQRLGIAQALLGDPDVILLDEPANGLDPMGMRELRELILELREKKNLTFFISSHLLDEIQQMCDRLVIIRNGKLITQGRKDELITDPTKRLEDVFVEMMTS